MAKKSTKRPVVKKSSKRPPRSLPTIHKIVKQTREQKVAEQTAKKKAARKELQNTLKRTLKSRFNKQTKALYTDAEIKKIIRGPSVQLQREADRTTRSDKYIIRQHMKKDGTPGKRYVTIIGRGNVTWSKFKEWKKRQDYWSTVNAYSEYHDLTKAEARAYLKVVYEKIHKGKRLRERTLRALKQSKYRKGKKPTDLQQQYLDQLAKIREAISEAYAELYT